MVKPTKVNVENVPVQMEIRYLKFSLQYHVVEILQSLVFSWI